LVLKDSFYLNRITVLHYVQTSLKQDKRRLWGKLIIR